MWNWIVKSPENIIAFFSMFAAAVSAAFSIWGYRISALALAISKRQQEVHEASVEAYLVESLHRSVGTSDVYAFAVTYTNRSDIANTLTRIDLAIKFFGVGGVGIELQFPVSATVPDGIDFNGAKTLSAPINLGPRTAESGWLIFAVPSNSIKGNIDIYKVVAQTADGLQVVLQTFLIRSVLDAN